MFVFLQPKYIGNLLKAAESRKKEEERRTERKVQKEREQEQGQFADKEAFVTSAYKKKMEEMQKEEEKERREAAMEGKNYFITLRCKCISIKPLALITFSV